MRMFVKLAAGAAAMGGLALAAPAAAQAPYPYAYPPQAYPQQQAYPYAPQYPGQQGYAQNPVGAIINQLLGNRYNVTDRTAITQCAAAAQAQAAAQYRPNGYGQGYQNHQGYPGYGGYNNAYGSARVTGITSVERRQNGLRVAGLMSSGMSSGYGGYGGQGYNPAYAQMANDLSFRCNVDYRGAVTNVRVRRNATYRG